MVGLRIHFGCVEATGSRGGRAVIWWLADDDGRLLTVGVRVPEDDEANERT